MTNVAPEEVFLTAPSQFYLGPKPDEINIRSGVFTVATIGDLTVGTINGVPMPSGTFVTTTGVQTLSNKSLIDTSTFIIRSGASPPSLQFNLAGAAASSATVITVNSTTGRTYTIPDSGTSAAFVMTEGNQSINGVKTFLGTISFAAIGATATSNQVVLGTGQTVTLTAPTPVASRVYTIPDVGNNASFVMTEGNQSINGTKIFLGTISFAAIGATATSNQLVLGTGQTVTLTAPTPVASRVYTIPDVGNNASFVMTEGAQTVNGTKTFANSITITSITNQFVIGTGTTTTIDVIPPAVSRVYTIPDVGANTSFLLSAGTQTVLGSKIFAQSIAATPTSNQILLGTGQTVTLTAPTPAASAVYTIPDVGVASEFVMTQGNQSISGTKTFLGAVIANEFVAPTFRTATGAMTISTATTSGTINITSAQTNGLTTNVFGPVGSPFGMQFGNQANTPTLFQAAAANQYVSGTISGDVGLQVQLGTAIFLGAEGQKYIDVSSSGISFFTGSGRLTNVFVNPGQTGIANFVIGAVTLNLRLRWARCGMLAMISIDAGTAVPAVAGFWTFSNGTGLIPTFMRPSVDLSFPAAVSYGGTTLNGYIDLDTTGVMRIVILRNNTISGVTADYSGLFPGAVASGLARRQNCSYILEA